MAPDTAATADISSELESFRQQWRAEVHAKTAAPPPPHAPAAGQPSGEAAAAGSGTGTEDVPAAGPRYDQQQQQQRRQRRPSSAAAGRAGGGRAGAPQTPMKLLSSGKKPPPVLPDNEDDDEEDYVPPRAFVDDAAGEPSSSAAEATAGDGSSAASASAPAPPAEPASALEHYEKAVEREAVGSLGDSLRHYRTAFRMDSAVDKKYKNKHYPAPVAKDAAATGATGLASATAAAPNPPASATATATVTARPAPAPGPPLPLSELIASFAGLGIEGAPPEVEGVPPPPCPLAALPDELLVHILQEVAVDDVGDFARLARVCRKLAFLVATEDRIWRRVCVGAEWGFARMHRTWQRAISWGPLPEEDAGAGADADAASSRAASLATTLALRDGPYTSWQRMFRQRPRIRFNGCYISTVNYIRPGQASASLVTWNSPVHIVTYFRYLRFFRDGTAISLLTTEEPADVVHHLTKDEVAKRPGGGGGGASAIASASDGAGGAPHPPAAVMQNALRGRWRLSAWPGAGADAGAGSAAATGPARPSTSTAAAAPPASLAGAVEAEGDLVVETEGIGKYYYRMELAVRSAGKGTRNNKLSWRGFYSYDRLTDDWGEFGLKNDRPFFFSRVRSYGAGE